MPLASPSNDVHAPAPLSGLLGLAERVVLWLHRREGWTAFGEVPASRKFVLVATPHTSNWDFVHFIGATTALGFRPHFMAKRSLFRWPMGGFMRAVGGIPVDRDRRVDMVTAMVAEFTQRDELMLTIAPEGTRGAPRRWKTGFYQIAMAAGVPIVIATMDYRRRRAGIALTLQPTGDYTADMARVWDAIADVVPRHPKGATRSLGNLLGHELP